MSRNNFEELEELLTKDRDQSLEKVQNNLLGTRSVFGFLGDLIELFIPRIMDVFVQITSADQSEPDSASKYPHEGGTI